MSFGLARGKKLDPGTVGLTTIDLPPLPDSIATDPAAAHLNVRAWFEHPGRPLEIEVGSGKGTFLVQQAQLQPETNFLGMEYAMEFYAYAADRIRRNQLANVRILGLDAAEFLHWRVPSGCARVVHLYFPDPWPKTKHHKRRMLSDRFLTDVYRVLETGGELRVVTDHDDYWKWMESHFDRWCAADHTPRFERLPFTRPASAGEGELVGTNFERKYRREGRPFNAAILRKTD